MGTGIAQVAAQIAKKKVILMDANQTQAEKSLKFIGAVLDDRFFLFLFLRR